MFIPPIFIHTLLLLILPRAVGWLRYSYLEIWMFGSWLNRPIALNMGLQVPLVTSHISRQIYISIEQMAKTVIPEKQLIKGDNPH